MRTNANTRARARRTRSGHDQGRGVRACRLLRARARGDGTGRKRGASVCLSPAAGSHGNGSICVSHANTGVHSNMSDVSVQATVSFIITFLKRTSLRQALSRQEPAPYVRYFGQDGLDGGAGQLRRQQ